MSKLKVFHASAGSGKTYKLTEAYLLLLFSNPLQYRNILAVTFTNKATAEMKNRIVAELYKLAYGKNSSYLQTLRETVTRDETRIQQTAQQALLYVLHDFSHFSVETIDSFFQKIIHGFTREIGLQTGFQLELDNARVLSEVIDRLLNQLNDSPRLKEWLIALAEEKIQSGKSWNIKKDLLDTGKEIFNETFQLFDKQLIEKLSHRDSLKSYLAALHQIKSSFEQHQKTLCEKALADIAHHGLSVGDFASKERGIAGLFNRLIHPKKTEEYKISDTRRGAADHPEKWYTQKSDKKDQITALFHHSLNDILKSLIEYHDRHFPQYVAAIQVLKNIRVLGAFTDISKALKQYAREENIFLLSDAGKLIRDVIRDNDAPFIYEKTGSHYHHFMIDEFQDTSCLQWKNFKPLIINSLGENNQSLVVGDIKQSVYRWRNSDWSIMAHDIYNDFQNQGIEKIALQHNWRSKENIIAFNNHFFEQAAAMLNPVFEDRLSGTGFASLTSLYGDVKQQIPSIEGKEGGYVHIEAIPEAADTNWKETVYSKLPEIIESLQDRNFRPGDTAIMVRKNKEGKEIADFLLNYKLRWGKPRYRYDIISEESLYTGSSPAVRFIIACLKYLTDPGDEVNKAFIHFEYRSYVKEMQDTPSHEWFTTEDDSLLTLLKEMETSISLYEMVEGIIQTFSLYQKQGETIFLNAFQDLILDYSKRGNPGTDQFLEWWEEEGIQKTVPVNEQQDAIRIITIHKAKGLEFENVIIPFCDWELDNGKQPLTWFYPESQPFNQLETIPLNYSKILADSVFRNQYYEEQYRNYIDNLNLLYVAFTRAKRQLFCFIPLRENDRNGDTPTKTNQLVYQVLHAGQFDGTAGFTNNHPVCSFGKPEISEKQEKTGTEHAVFTIEHMADYRDKLRIRYNSLNYFEFSDDKRLEKINYGKVMHEVFENIAYVKDIPMAMNRMITAGKLSAGQAAFIESEMLELMKHPEIKEWFSDKWQVKNEHPLLLPNGKQLRPDRLLISGKQVIVIEYKFGENPAPEHERQVNSYLEHLKEVGFSTLKAYIWYINLKKVVRVS